MEPETQTVPVPEGIEISFVLPCLNEALTIGDCIAECRKTIEASEVRAEIIVADNGSTDGSPEIAGCFRNGGTES